LESRNGEREKPNNLAIVDDGGGGVSWAKRMTLALISEATLLYTTHYPTHSTIRSVIKRNKKPVEKKKKKKSNDNDNNKKQPSEILKIKKRR
jgi:hypothetical protein